MVNHVMELLWPICHYVVIIIIITVIVIVINLFVSESNVQRNLTNNA